MGIGGYNLHPYARIQSIHSKATIFQFPEFMHSSVCNLIWGPWLAPLDWTSVERNILTYFIPDISWLPIMGILTGQCWPLQYYVRLLPSPCNTVAEYIAYMPLSYGLETVCQRSWVWIMFSLWQIRRKPVMCTCEHFPTQASMTQARCMFRVNCCNNHFPPSHRINYHCFQNK